MFWWLIQCFCNGSQKIYLDYPFSCLVYTTIKKATIMHISNATHNIESWCQSTNIESWCQKVLDLLDLMFADFVDLHGHIWEIISLICAFQMGHFTNFATNFWEISIISSNKGGNRWTIDEISGFVEYFRYFQNPSQATQAMLTQRQRKFELFNPSQA